MTHFLSLPPEIRTLIYEYCLVVGKVYPMFSQLSFETYGYNQDLLNYELPDMALLRVSKQINLEAEKILYSRNTFVMPVLEDMERLYERYLQTPRRDALLWIRSVEVAFHTHDLSRTKRESILRSQYSELMRDVLTMHSVSQFDFDHVGSDLHDSFCKGLTESAWPRKATLLTRNLRLFDLWIFLDGAWCMCGSCSLRDEAVECLSHGFVYGLPCIIELVGVAEPEIEEAMTVQIIEGHKEYEKERVQDKENGTCNSERGAEEEDESG